MDLTARLVRWLYEHRDYRPIPEVTNHYATSGGLVFVLDLSPRPFKTRLRYKPRPRYFLRSLRAGVTIRRKGEYRNRRPRLDVRLGGRKITANLSTLVCTAFHGPRPVWASAVAHRNGDRRDNRAENLRWSSVEGNKLDEDWHRIHPGTIRPGDLDDPEREVEVLDLERDVGPLDTTAAVDEAYGF